MTSEEDIPSESYGTDGTLLVFESRVSHGGCEVTEGRRCRRT